MKGDYRKLIFSIVKNVDIFADFQVKRYLYYSRGESPVTAKLGGIERKF